MQYTVNHPLLVGIHTTKQRANVVNELLLELDRWIAPGDILFAYPEMPTLHFITDTKPFLGNPWPLIMPVSSFAEMIADRVKGGSLPIVVRSIVLTNTFNWPDRLVFYSGESELEIEGMMNKFLHEKCYYRAWSNSAFEILVASKECVQ